MGSSVEFYCCSFHVARLWNALIVRTSRIEVHADM